MTIPSNVWRPCVSVGYLATSRMSFSMYSTPVLLCSSVVLPLLVYDTEVGRYTLSAVSLLVHRPFVLPQKVNDVLQAQFSLYLCSKEDCLLLSIALLSVSGPHFEMRSQEPFARYPLWACPNYQCQFLSRPLPYLFSVTALREPV